ncbi:MAG: hypothetical protein ACI9JE_001962, partial [Candidatus Krumholzibacteriia bacterium]
GDYGVCDMEHLIATSGKANSVKVSRDGNDYFIPVGRFDNRVDKTSFIRDEPDQWSAEDKSALQAGMREAFDQLASGNDE